jgi:hypothetical protein
VRTTTWTAVPAACGSAEDDAADDTTAGTTSGASSRVETITREVGAMHVALGGMPLYTYAGDSDAGDVTGQGIGGIRWVVAPDGTKVTGAPAPAPPASSAAEAPPVPGD